MINNTLSINSYNKTVYPSFGNKHLINRYLYHATTMDSYKRMLEAGTIKTTLDVLGKSLNGVFLISLDNFLKRWKNINGTDLCYELFNKIAPFGDELVMLRIPTKSLNKELIRFRSLDKLFQAKFKDKLSKLDRNAHEIIGEPANAVKAKIAGKHEPIEYIYTSSIPIETAEFVGQANFKNIKIIGQQLSRGRKLKEVHDNAVKIALNTLFENQPEINAVTHILAMEK